jgi:hypothetical protein
MVLVASGYEETALDLIAAMASRCATAQTVCEVADPAGVLARTILRWGGDASTGQAEADATGYDDEGNPVDGGALTAVSMTGDEIELDDGQAWLLLDEAGPSEHTELAPGTWRVTGSARLTLSLPADPTDLPFELLRRAGNTAQAILAELKAQVGIYGSLYAATFALSRIQLEGALSQRPTRATATIDISWGE